MATSVLGKRTRAAVTDVSSSPSLRSKRQATTVIYNDENSDPLTPRSTRSRTKDIQSMDLDELPDAISIKGSPLKRKATDAQVASSAARIKSHFNTVKHSTDENTKPSDEYKIPQTPRRREQLSKIAPTTPRHRVIIPGNALTPRTPRTPTTPRSSTTSVYNAARQLFSRSSDPGRLTGRDDERMEIKTFINGCIESNTGGCTYVSGPPGTGKSALVTEVVSEFQETENVRKAYVNCMSMKNSKDVYGMLLDTFYQDVEIMEGEQLTTLQGMFVPRKRSNILYLVTLDEIDHLVSLDLEFMYKLFEWALQKSSRLVLVGIANALDLTDRLLPRLKARNLKPQLLPFLPYTAPQIKAVVITRLKSLLPEAERDGDFVPFVHPAAIELCSRKIAGQTGDLRKALDIVRRAIELVETETIRKRQQMLSEEMPNSPSRTPLSENNNLSSPPARSPSKHAAAATLRDLTMQTAPRASIAHLNKITSSTLGNGTNQRLKTLNLQQKAALCALVALEKRNRLAASNVMLTPSKNANAAPTVKKLYDTYCMLCRQETVLHPLTSTEFRDVIGSLETLSLISAVDSKNGSFVGLTTPSKRGRKPGFGGGVGVGDEKRVASVIGEKELQQGVEGLGAPILLSILSGEGLE